MSPNRNFFHIHLVSDSTGETLLTVARAAAARYENIHAIEHVYPLVRSTVQMERVIRDIEAAPGIVLYTLVDDGLVDALEGACREFSLPCRNVLDPIHNVFQAYLNLPLTAKIGGQHALDADYFRRIEALNYTMMHDDGQLPDDLETADVILVGISRTSKTPTSMYLANRGIKTVNVPIVPTLTFPERIKQAIGPLIVALTASPDRILHIRRNRLMTLNASNEDNPYVDRRAIAEEIAYTKRLCVETGWPVIDVTRRSIEETAAEVLSLKNQRDAARLEAQLEG
ncbi:MAG: pyruvate, water dikinase regulatory protein [Pseudomonadota bacterium]